MKPLTIGEVARQACVGIETMRFYERQGLLEEPERRASGYRQYDQEAVAVLKFIRRAKELGFTLKEIKGLLAHAWMPRPHEPKCVSRLRRRLPTSKPRSLTSNECGMF